MNVLSLFDGMSCGRIALERNGVKVSNYYASEVDKYAITVSKKNYPDIVQLGDVTKWREWNIDFASIDLLIGGSPCQGFSFAGGQLAFNDPRSKLFFVYADIMNHILLLNPKLIFLLENVKMKKESEDVISMIMGANPIKINSALVSAQNRNRLYWTNIEGVEQPEDKGILLKDIIHEAEILEDELTPNFNINPSEKGMNGNVRSVNNDKSSTLTTNKGEGLKVPFDKTLQILDKEIEKGTVGFFRKDSQGYRVYFIHGKSITLNASSGGLGGKTGLYLFGNIIKTDEEKGNVNKFYTLTNKNGNGILIEGYIRKLTPIECERLQTVPDNYTEGVSNSQRYKMLGNGWTVDIICHILCNM
jgi:DNA (cytosine-5)-methyltransferase 3A